MKKALLKKKLKERRSLNQAIDVLRTMQPTFPEPYFSDLCHIISDLFGGCPKYVLENAISGNESQLPDKSCTLEEAIGRLNPNEGISYDCKCSVVAALFTFPYAEVQRLADDNHRHHK